MIAWAMDYWFVIAAALLIGVAIGWWVWTRRAPARIAPPDAAPRAPMVPIKPDIAPAAPAAFAAAPPPVAPSPAPSMAAGGRPAITPAVGAPDNLRLVKGVGPKLNLLLAQLGISRFDQIAAWSADDIVEVDRFLGAFAGRITRDNWVDQAAYLARGDRAGFEAKYGALGGEL